MKCQELKAIGMSDKKIARIVYGFVDEWSLMMVDLETPTSIKTFFETLFFLEDDFRDRCFLRNRCEQLVELEECEE